jgi:thymidine kinase
MSNCYTDSDAGLDIIIGPMFSGKTTELLRRLTNASSVGMSTLYINNVIDNRNEHDVFSTHNSQIKSNLSDGNKLLKMISVDDLKMVDDNYVKGFDVIGVDECQFFKVLIPILEWVKLGKRVIAVSLDADYESKPFGNILSLIPKCDTVHKLRAYCTHCAKNKTLKLSSFTHRINTINHTEKIEVGASDKYESLCFKCFDKANPNLYV